MVYISQRGYGVYPYIRFLKQRGKGLGSIFRGFLRLVKPLVSSGIRAAKPLLQQGIKVAKPHLKRQLKRGLSQGLDIITDLAKDFINDRIKTSKKSDPISSNRTISKKKRKVNKKATQLTRAAESSRTYGHVRRTVINLTGQKQL